MIQICNLNWCRRILIGLAVFYWILLDLIDFVLIAIIFKKLTLKIVVQDILLDHSTRYFPFTIKWKINLNFTIRYPSYLDKAIFVDDRLTWGYRCFLSFLLSSIWFNNYDSAIPHENMIKLTTWNITEKRMGQLHGSVCSIVNVLSKTKNTLTTRQADEDFRYKLRDYGFMKQLEAAIGWKSRTGFGQSAS